MINYSRQLISAHQSGDKRATYELGFCYYYGIGVERDLKTAIEYYEASANAGCEDAMIELANCYLRGIGTCKRVDKAIDLLEKCADRDNAYACYLLGDIYTYGPDLDGFYVNDVATKKAKRYYEKSARLGYTEAEYQYGYECYADSNGADRKFQLAKELLQKSASKGHKRAQYELGRLYRYLAGGERIAIEWLERSANRGVKEAIHMLGDIYQDKGDYAKAIEYYSYATSELEESEIELCESELARQGKAPTGNVFCPSSPELCLDTEGKSARELFEEGLWHEKMGNMELAFELVSRAHELGYAPAHNKKGDMQYKGAESLYARTNKIFKDMAMKCYLENAQNGDVYAQRMVGVISQSRQDMLEAVKWLQKSAEAGDSVSMFKLGTLYNSGIGVAKSVEQAIVWLEKSAICGYYSAQMELAVILSDGQGVPKDMQKSFEWMEKSANQGSSYACYLLGQMYEKGEGVTQSRVKALEYYEKALDGYGYLSASAVKKAIKRVKC